MTDRETLNGVELKQLLQDCYIRRRHASVGNRWTSVHRGANRSVSEGEKLGGVCCAGTAKRNTVSELDDVSVSTNCGGDVEPRRISVALS